MYNFIEKCINGDALHIEIDDYIDEWHEGDYQIPLHEFLGMSPKEYVLFVEDEAYLNIIITARMHKASTEQVYNRVISMAARADDVKKAERLKKWLETEKLWD